MLNGQFFSCSTIVSDIDGVALSSKTECDRIRQFSFVFDNEQAHAKLLYHNASNSALKSEPLFRECMRQGRLKNSEGEIKKWSIP